MCTRDIFVYIDDSSWSLLDSEAQNYEFPDIHCKYSSKLLAESFQISRQIDMMNESDNYSRPHVREF